MGLQWILIHFLVHVNMWCFFPFKNKVNHFFSTRDNAYYQTVVSVSKSIECDIIFVSIQQTEINGHFVHVPFNILTACHIKPINNWHVSHMPYFFFFKKKKKKKYWLKWASAKRGVVFFFFFFFFFFFLKKNMEYCQSHSHN